MLFYSFLNLVSAKKNPQQIATFFIPCTRNRA